VVTPKPRATPRARPSFHPRKRRQRCVTTKTGPDQHKSAHKNPWSATYDRWVGDLQAIGYGGQPVPEVFRVVRPPQIVLVDLATLFPRRPHQTGHYQPLGLQMHKVVEGQVSCWGICEQGQWWGLVTYEIAYGTKKKAVTHWIPAWVLKRKS
jgi:hypothetical protein